MLLLFGVINLIFLGMLSNSLYYRVNSLNS